jgi:hypothetical protein
MGDPHIQGGDRVGEPDDQVPGQLAGGVNQASACSTGSPASQIGDDWKIGSATHSLFGSMSI